MALGYAWFDSYDSVGYVLTLHIFPPYSLPWAHRGAPGRIGAHRGASVDLHADLHVDLHTAPDIRADGLE